MKIITGFCNEPHITSQQDQAVNMGIFGESGYILRTGKQLKAEEQSNNEIRILDGVLIFQGCASAVEYGTYDSVEISNGSQGMKRIDLIVARYKKDAETQVESMDWAVIQGTPDVADPQVPTYTKGNIQAGDLTANMPVYEVHLNGVSIEEIRLAAPAVLTAKELEEKGMLIRKVLTAEDDLDRIFENGLYWYLTGDIPKNAPFDNEAIVEVFGSNEDTKQKIQRATRSGRRGEIAERPIHSPRQSNDVWSYVYCGSKRVGVDNVLHPSDIVTSGSDDNSKVPGAGFFKSTIDKINTEIGKTVKETDIVTVETASNSKVPSAGYVKKVKEGLETEIAALDLKLGTIKTVTHYGLTCYYTYVSRVLVVNIRGTTTKKMPAFERQIFEAGSEDPEGGSSSMVVVGNEPIPVLLSYEVDSTGQKKFVFQPVRDIPAETWISTGAALIV